nr:chorismate-binding protein [Liquorilactobacillus satsumensis]
MVGIRAAVLKENQAYLFAGAGIVAESSPDKEVHETHLKFQPLLQALGGNDE